ncbi:demethoxyubiquinone hydroxylase family protein [Candidatus Tisiphia endosymbiont of Sialis lutaria]|uniref:demethoxyubiquinone hydroxylase family protein n=1 Tax=Candidatus Tisiphia endosymbiont of Sialis lutaria TaxID=2029164 RepID=UPI0025C96C59|nr:demethoxyubiquinone hydroxylase family protein [Candidatus Tisiphia sp.]
MVAGAISDDTTNFSSIDYNLEKELLDSIKQFQSDETEHKDIALVQGSNEVVFAPLINKIIKLMCNIAISLSKKI